MQFNDGKKKGTGMTQDEEDEFLTSLRIGEELAGQGAEPDTHAKMPRLRERRGRKGQNVPFNQSILRSTAEGLYDIAIKHGWTMNRTVTEAYKLLAQADEEGKL